MDLISALNLLLLAGLLVRAAFKGQLSRYSLFYTYIAYYFLATAGLILIEGSYGLQSPEYRNFYNYANLLVPVFHLLILARIHRTISPGSFAQRVALGSLVVGAVSLPVLWTLMTMTGALFYRIQAASLVLQVAACVVVLEALIARSDIDVGRNIRGIVFGISLLATIQSYNFLSIFTEAIRYEVFRLLVPMLYAGTLLIFTYSLWEYHPAVATPDRFVEIRLTQRLRQALRTTITLIFG